MDTEYIKKALWEAIKEGLRLAAFAFVSFIVSWAVNQVNGAPQTEMTVMLTFALRAVDKWLYTYGKESGDDTMKGGLTRF